MIERELEHIGHIIEDVVGKSRHGLNIGAWSEFCCPSCAAEKGVESDHKYNLCVNFEEGYFHCWACGYSGKISRLLKDYGSSDHVNEFYEIITAIKNSEEYKLKGNAFVKKETETMSYLTLPEGYKPIASTDKHSYPAYLYLKERGIDYNLINEYKIGYVGWSDDFKMRTRIVIPSYDQYNNLNYYVTRDYSGKQKLKYVNPKVEKTKIIFNEGRINWGENVTLCEGVFDSIVIPNSIPLLGKRLDEDSAVYKALVEQARCNINIFLDDDAIEDAKKMYRLLDKQELKGRIRLIECPQGYDASLYYQTFGKWGIYNLMLNARKIEDYETIFWSR